VCGDQEALTVLNRDLPWQRKAVLQRDPCTREDRETERLMSDNTSQQKLDSEALPAKPFAQQGSADEAAPESGLRAQLFDRATKMKEQAQSSLSSLADKTDELVEQAAAKVEELKDAGSAKLLETLDDFNNSLPILREAGFSLMAIELGMGIPPSLVAEFHPSQEASTANVERLLAQHADKKLTVVLIKALHNAWQVQSKIAIGGLTPTEILVEVGLIPSVKVKFT
jgi:hypothetical protein